jgi:hypothetical protein
MSTRTKRDTSETAILSRVFGSSRELLSPDLARYLLGLRFDSEDQARIHELADKNQEGRISPQELQELDGYVRIGDLLAILQSQARKTLKSNLP